MFSTMPSVRMTVAILSSRRADAFHVVLTYLISPRLCHRFVAYLEEEAVVT